MGAGPRQVVLATPLAPPRVGLVASAHKPNDLDDRWTNGFQFLPESCGGGVDVIDPCDAGTKSDGVNPDIVSYEPFGIVAADSCSTIGWKSRDWIGRAKRLLAACESKQIEAEFWTGTQAQASGWPNAFLASPEADELSSSPVTPLQALACLEQGLAECGCGGQGMIHATRQVVTEWVAQRLIFPEGNQLLTAMGTVVVPGAGYDGSAPDGSAAASGSIWAYGTGMVSVRRSAPEVVPGNTNQMEMLVASTNRATNFITVRAEELAAATWDRCCHLAVAIDLDLCAIGS